MTVDLPYQAELKDFFQKDTDVLTARAAELIAPLIASQPSLEQTQELRNVFHGLRGAAAAVGASAVRRFIEQIERLLEVADTFKSASVEQALAIYRLVADEMPHLRETIEATIHEQFDHAEATYQTAHARFTQQWGDYLHEDDFEPDDEPPRSKPLPTAPAAPKPQPTATTRSAESVAASFLDQLGGIGGAAKSPKPARVSKPFPEPSNGHREPSVRKEPSQPSTPSHTRAQSPPKPAVTEPVRLKSSVAAAKVPAPVVPSAPQEAVDPEMLSFFVQETAEALENLEATLLNWEKNPQDRSPARTLFRIAHTIKGAANSIGLSQIGGLMHRLEDLFETHVVDRDYPRQKELVTLVFGVADAVKGMIQEAQGTAPAGSSQQRVSNLLARIGELADESPANAVPQPEAAPTMVAAQPSTVTNVEPAVAVPVAQETPVEPAPVAERTEAIEDRTIRVESEQLDLLMNLTGELVISRSRLETGLTDIGSLRDEWNSCRVRLLQIISDFQGKHEYSQSRLRQQRRFETPSDPANPPANRAAGGRMDLSGFSELEFDQYDEFNILSRSLMEVGTDTAEIFNQLSRFQNSFLEETGRASKITAQLQDEITRTRMVPLTGLFRRLQRAIRDAAVKGSKTVKVVTEGAEARMDKIIADQVYTPLMHVVRNAVAHGIEDAATRAAAGKPAAGTVHIKAHYEANQVVLRISDDGRGLDYEAIRRRGIERGLIPVETPATHEALANLIFQSGFSTALATTDVAGRGVGLDVLRREISRLNGAVHVESETGKGCTFIVRLPLTLSINQAMLVNVGGETYALPLNFIERVLDCNAGSIEASGGQELFKADDNLVPLMRLHHVLGLPAPQKRGSIILVRVADRRLALFADSILRKQEIVVKSLGGLLGRSALFSGATLSGEGLLLPILDLPNLLQISPTLTERSGQGTVSTDTAANGGSVRPEILVVDDSLSVRKVIEKHLISSGLNVHLAVDGLDALEHLRTRSVDLVLTDLEMPRMHGFELIAEMRRQPALASLPVIVVTSRDAEKHRRRAADLGANEFIIKPFSREQLVERIQRLLGAAALTAAE